MGAQSSTCVHSKTFMVSVIMLAAYYLSLGRMPTIIVTTLQGVNLS